jgi:hypothetical protein
MRSPSLRLRALGGLLGSLGLVAFMAGVPVSGSGYEWTESLARLTFSGTVALPGVQLPAGAYRFRALRADLVQVVSDDGRRVIFTGFTHRIPRPRRVENNEVMVVFGERSPDSPPRISVWYPRSGEGHEFIYR